MAHLRTPRMFKTKPAIIRSLALLFSSLFITKDGQIDILVVVVIENLNELLQKIVLYEHVYDIEGDGLACQDVLVWNLQQRGVFLED